MSIQLTPANQTITLDINFFAECCWSDDLQYSKSIFLIIHSLSLGNCVVVEAVGTQPIYDEDGDPVAQHTEWVMLSAAESLLEGQEKLLEYREAGRYVDLLVPKSKELSRAL